MATDLSTLGAGLTEPMAKVANNLIDKVCTSIGWLFKLHGIKEAKMEAKKSIISEISQRDDINAIERYIIIDNIQQMVKKHKNIDTILEKTLQYLEPTAKPEYMDNDWISFFFDRAGLISDERMQLLWAKILAGEANNPNSYSKNLVHILSIMSIQDANNMINLTRFCAYFKNCELSKENEKKEGYIALVYSHSRDIIGNNNPKEYYEYYEKNGIQYINLVELQRLGLILFNIGVDICYGYRKIDFVYGKDMYSLKFSSNEFRAGNVLLTSEGEALVNICEKSQINDFIPFCIKNWTKMGYEVEKKS